ncbi:hypothetical protein EBM89_15885 [Cellulomonas triticagri]|uniref:Uncharacterized protein n=1 Tax=Cellulomonas triticagri TaxID=2483352 RepID=A0A3M2IZP5_9CELL|nr:hypothetical protein EBM89_15885 [Cellulomonas triticagri]
MFLRSRQVGTACVTMLACGLMVALGGDLNLPVPGAEVPIVVGTLAPLVQAWAVLSCADGDYRWIETVTPRSLAHPRMLLLGVLSLVAVALVFTSAWLAMGSGTALALVCSFWILAGLGTVGWVAGGRVPSLALPLVFTLTCISFGSGSGDGGAARWALLLVEPGAPEALAAAALGMLVAVSGWWTRDRIPPGPWHRLRDRSYPRPRSRLVQRGSR